MRGGMGGGWRAGRGEDGYSISQKEAHLGASKPRPSPPITRADA